MFASYFLAFLSHPSLPLDMVCQQRQVSVSFKSEASGGQGQRPDNGRGELSRRGTQGASDLQELVGRTKKSVTR